MHVARCVSAEYPSTKQLLRVWQTARELTRQVYDVTNDGPFESDWALKDQIRRAAISVMSNIAEGFESRTRSLFVDFLGRAKASAREVRAQLVVARDQEYLNEGEFEEVHDRADKVSRQLHNLIQSLEKLFGGRSVACDFVDLVQNGFYIRLVAPLQGSFERHFATSPTVSRLQINPPNSF